jgi:hypothetical protein
MTDAMHNRSIILHQAEKNWWYFTQLYWDLKPKEELTYYFELF